MVFMKIINNAKGIDVFIGNSVDSIKKDTNNFKAFGDLFLQPESAQEITEQEALAMGIDPVTINEGKKSFEKDECSFYLTTMPLPV
jgi:hypothetical protein